MIYAPVTCLTLNRLQKSDGRMWKQTFEQFILETWSVTWAEPIRISYTSFKFINGASYINVPKCRPLT